jgi:hypothetical protein
VYHRLFFGHAPLSPDLAATMVAHLMSGIGVPAPGQADASGRQRGPTP